MEQPGATATEAAAAAPNWLALPNGVLQYIFCLASTWQIPGSCLAAHVCSAWRAAAAGCRGIHLLYNAGFTASDQLLVAWLGRNRHQLGSFTLNSPSHDVANLVLGALTPPAASADVAASSSTAAAAGASSGGPLPLHTLCVLGWGPSVSVVARLLPALPKLGRLQLIQLNVDDIDFSPGSDLCQGPLGCLKQATQLRELHVKWPENTWFFGVGAVLSPSLQRFTLETERVYASVPDLSHLTRLTFLQLDSGVLGLTGSSAGKLPAALKELHMAGVGALADVALEQPQLVTGATTYRNQDQLSNLINLRSLRCGEEYMCSSSGQKALAQLTALSVRCMGHSKNGLPPETRAKAVSTAASIRSLRRLDFNMISGMPVMPGLSQLTGVTWLFVYTHSPGAREEYAAWAAELGQMPWLRWLSVPHHMLAVPGQPWLGNLKQLQVLEVWLKPPREPMEKVKPLSSKEWHRCQRYVAKWLENGNLRAVADHLQLLMVTGFPQDQAATLQLRCRLQQLVGSSGCEVVVGMFDPTEQLAQLPEALQQALK